MENKVNFQWGLQLSMVKFLTPHWYVSADLQFMVLNHRSDISSISSDRTEVNGTTKIYIDSNGNTTSITGPTGPPPTTKSMQSYLTSNINGLLVHLLDIHFTQKKGPIYLFIHRFRGCWQINHKEEHPLEHLTVQAR